MKKVTIIGNLVSTILKKSKLKGKNKKIQAIIGEKYFFQTIDKKDWYIKKELYSLPSKKLIEFTSKIDQL